MQQIIGAVADNDINIIKEQAHSIKGSSLVLGFSTISDCARTLEQNSREGQITPHAIDQINSELAELASFLA
ncbi:Hpt domain-containing protein [Marivita sp.]|jgi:HPt (histidine-containing phosphotransfer) domain-containing protein